MSVVVNSESMNGVAHAMDTNGKHKDASRRKADRANTSEAVEDPSAKKMRINKRRRKADSDELPAAVMGSNQRQDFNPDGKRVTERTNSASLTKLVSRKNELRRGGRLKHEQNENDTEKPIRKAGRRIENGGGVRLERTYRLENKAKSIKDKEKEKSDDVSDSKSDKRDGASDKSGLDAKLPAKVRFIGKSEKQLDRERNSNVERNRFGYSDRKRSEAEKQVEQKGSDSDSGGNESDDSDRDDSDSDAEDIVELDRRKTEKAEELADLERQFRELRSALYTERLASIEDRLNELRSEQASEFCTPREMLREALDTRVGVAKHMRKFRTDLEQQRTIASRQAIELTIEERKQNLIDSIREDLYAQLRTLFARAKRVETSVAPGSERSRSQGNHSKRSAGILSKRLRNGMLRSRSQSANELELGGDVACNENEDPETKKKSAISELPRRAGDRLAARRNGAARRRRAKRMARKVDEPFVVYQLTSDEIQDDMVRLRAAITRGQAISSSFFGMTSFGYAAGSANFGASSMAGVHLQPASGNHLQLNGGIPQFNAMQSNTHRGIISNGSGTANHFAAAFGGSITSYARTPIVT